MPEPPPPPRPPPRPGPGRDIVATVLAVGVATALNGVVFAVTYDALTSQVAGLSENATQVLTGAFGGMIGILGTYIGLKARQEQQPHDDHEWSQGPPSAPPTAAGAPPAPRADTGDPTV